MKKLLSLLVMGILSLGLVACSATNTQESQENFEKVPTGLNQEIGSGDLTLSTPTGTSKENKAIVFVGSDNVFEKIDLETYGFDESKMSYIYIDGDLYTKEQLENTKTVLELQEDALKPGVHIVEVVQYDKETSDGKAVIYKAANYEIKEK